MSWNLNNFDWLDPRLVEAVNGAWFVQSFALVVITGIILWVERTNYRRLYYRLAVAMFAYHIGEGAARFLFWLLRHLANTGQPSEWLSSLPIFPIAAVIASVALLCKIRVITEERWGNFFWVAALAASAVFVVWSFAVPRIAQAPATDPQLQLPRPPPGSASPFIELFHFFF